jgi:pimeloyl-ACP methyl ester carboxylesterase
MDHLAISKAHICGISMGCAVAVDFTLAYPDMSKSLIAVGPWVNGYTSPKVEVLFSVMREMSGILKEKGSKEALDFMFKDIFSWFKGSKEGQRIREIGMDYSFWHFTHDDPSIYLKPPSSQQLSRIRIPSLIITSEYDLPGCIEIADLMERDIPNSQKVVIKNASHLMNIDKPEEFNKFVLDFIGGLCETN